jgi:hypothetical protein
MTAMGNDRDDHIIAKLDREITAIVQVAGEDGPPLDVLRPHPYCFHRHVLVWQDRPRVDCKTCGATLDAHQVLLDYANKERSFYWKNEEAKRLLAEMNKRIEDLKREERNLKARVKRVRDA